MKKGKKKRAESVEKGRRGEENPNGKTNCKWTKEQGEKETTMRNTYRCMYPRGNKLCLEEGEGEFGLRLK